MRFEKAPVGSTKFEKVRHYLGEWLILAFSRSAGGWDEIPAEPRSEPYDWMDEGDQLAEVIDINSRRGRRAS